MVVHTSFVELAREGTDRNEIFGEVELADQVKRGAEYIRAEKILGAGIQQKPILLFNKDASARPFRSIEDDDFAPALLETKSAREARKPRADDRNGHAGVLYLTEGDFHSQLQDFRNLR